MNRRALLTIAVGLAVILLVLLWRFVGSTGQGAAPDTPETTAAIDEGSAELAPVLTPIDPATGDRTEGERVPVEDVVAKTTFAGSATILGRCVDRAGNPWEGVDVVLGENEVLAGRTVVSDAEGEFRFEGVEEGNWDVAVTAHGGHRFGAKVKVRGAEENVVEIVIPRAATLRGRVRYSKGAPAPGMGVRVGPKPPVVDFSYLYVHPGAQLGQPEFATYAADDGTFALPAPSHDAVDEWLVHITAINLPFAHRILSAAEMASPPFVELVVLEPVRLHGDVRWSDGAPVCDIFVNPMVGDGTQRGWGTPGSTVGGDGAFDFFTTPEAVAIVADGLTPLHLRHELHDLEPGEERELHLVLERPDDAVFVYFTDEKGEPLPRLLSLSWEEMQSHPLTDAELHLGRPGEPSIQHRVQRARRNPEVVRLGKDRPLFLELLRNGVALAEGVWLERPGDVTLRVDARGGKSRELRLVIPQEILHQRTFYYRVGSWDAWVRSGYIGRPLDLGVQEEGTLFVFLSSVAFDHPERGFAHRLQVSIPAVGNPAPITVVPHPLFEIDTAAIPDEFWQGDGELEILDRLGEVVWRGALGEDFGRYEKHQVPLPPEGGIQARRGANVHRLH